MSEMLERVARALAERRTPFLLPCHYAAASRAIAAIREPTEGMLEAGVEAWTKCDLMTLLEDDLLAVWQAMIDKALEE